MRSITVNKKFGYTFSKKYIPKLYVRMIKEELAKGKHRTTLLKVFEKFNVTKEDLLNVITINNIIVSQVKDDYIVRFNKVLVKEKVSLEHVIDYANDGDLSFRGSNLFNNITKYINKNIRLINRYYLMKGG